MTRYTFAELDRWTLKTRQRMNAVVKGATQDVIARAQKPRAKGGRMPVLTGALRGSMISTLYGGTALTGPESYVMVAAQMEAGDVATFEWGAEYAGAVNSGRRGRAGAHFMEAGVDYWPQAVAENIRIAKTAVK